VVRGTAACFTSALKVEPVCLSETLVVQWRHIHRRENLRSHINESG
jgi:hypothetical protein